MKENIKLIYYPEKKLYTKSKKVDDPKDPEVQAIVRKMLEIMHREKGIGISAIQVNVPLQIVISESQGEKTILFNPKIYKKSLKKEVDIEGCLSIPGVYGPVKRSRSIRAVGLNENGEEINIRASGLAARVLQHEYDHTQGILFIDKMVKSKESRKLLEKLQKLTDRM